MTVIYNNLYWDHEPIDTYYWHHHIIITMAIVKKWQQIMTTIHIMIMIYIYIYLYYNLMIIKDIVMYLLVISYIAVENGT